MTVPSRCEKCGEPTNPSLPAPMPASLHHGLVTRLVTSFPASGDWHQVCCAKLRANSLLRSDARNWSPFTPVGSTGGVYAFLFPQSFFLATRQIILDGPGRRQIPFHFSAQPKLLV